MFTPLANYPASMKVYTVFQGFLLYALTCAWSHAHAAAVTGQNNPVYKAKTGKTYDQLVATHAYIPLDVFANATDSEWKDHSRVDSLDSRNSPDPSRIDFYLYNSDHKKGVRLRKRDVQYYRDQDWKSSLPLKVIIHGYLNDVTSEVVTSIKDAYMATRPAPNVIAVDWGAYSQSWYFTSAKHTDPIGTIVGEWIWWVQEAGLTRLPDVHVIGFSLGAHIAGEAGNYIHGAGNRKESIGRITGLDPAGPSFYESAHRLDPSDGAFVDVIHTNMGDLNPLSRVKFGLGMPCGHADFYPNGGETQPECQLPLVGELVGTCSHSKAFEYFAASIRTPDKYKGCGCASWTHYQRGECKCDASTEVYMGEGCKYGVAASYYLRT